MHICIAAGLINPQKLRSFQLMAASACCPGVLLQLLKRYTQHVLAVSESCIALTHQVAGQDQLAGLHQLHLQFSKAICCQDLRHFKVIAVRDCKLLQHVLRPLRHILPQILTNSWPCVGIYCMQPTKQPLDCHAPSWLRHDRGQMKSGCRKQSQQHS